MARNLTCAECKRRRSPLKRVGERWLCISCAVLTRKEAKGG